MVVVNFRSESIHVAPCYTDKKETRRQAKKPHPEVRGNWIGLSIKLEYGNKFGRGAVYSMRARYEWNE